MERAWLGAAVTVQAQGEAGHLSSYEDRRNALEFCQGLISPRSLSAWRARRCSDKALPIPGCVCWPSRAQSGPLDGSRNAHRETLCPPDAPGCALGSTQAGTRWRNLDSPAGDTISPLLGAFQVAPCTPRGRVWHGGHLHKA